ncbi:MAG: hypothetical protein ACLFO2_03570 [Candidatus Woesearchaeota archaeon]
MRYLSGKEEVSALSFLEEAAVVAREATCHRARCGSVIVKDGVVVGEGSNTPPGGLESQRRCSNEKDVYHRKVTDKTCCVHAEQRAIMDALKRNPDRVRGSRLYFVRIGEDGEMTRAGAPYCTICSKMSLDAGVSEFVLWHEDGVCVYDMEEYNDLSFRFGRG